MNLTNKLPRHPAFQTNALHVELQSLFSNVQIIESQSFQPYFLKLELCHIQDLVLGLTVIHTKFVQVSAPNCLSTAGKIGQAL